MAESHAISWEDKFKLDVWYVDNWSVWLDVKIVLMTVLKVLRRDGISQEGEATVQEFLGSHAKALRYKNNIAQLCRMRMNFEPALNDSISCIGSKF